MNNEESVNIATQLWDHFNNSSWDSARKLLADDFEAFWPQSKEKIIGPENFIGLNRDYPGSHKIEVLNINSDYDRWDKTVTVIAQVKIETKLPDGKILDLFAVSFFEIKDEKIMSATEYWADSYPAPEWRAKYVEQQ